MRDRKELPEPQVTTPAPASEQSAAGDVHVVQRETAPGVGVHDLSALQGAGGNQAMVQLSATAGGGTEAVHAAAQHGTSGGGGSLPHLDTIQQSFGGHDVTGVKSHVGGRAAEANDAMGASAYASGSNVAFKEAPTLHTAAHEAAHIVQQRAGVSLSGGVGKAGDSYERNADAVADAVVAGKSAAPLLDQVSGGGRGGGVQQIQKKGGHDVSPLPAGTVPIMAVQFEDGPDDTRDPTPPPLPAGANEDPDAPQVQWAKPKTSQSKNMQVWYLVPADESDRDKVELTDLTQRYYFPSEPAIEAKAAAFESALGMHAFSNPAANEAAAAMSGKVIEVLDDYQQALHLAGEKLANMENLIPDTLGSANLDYAGAVGTSERVIREAAAQGNLRERLFMCTNFAWNFGAAFLNRTQAGEVRQFVAGLEADSPILQQQIQSLSADNDSLTRSGLPQPEGEGRDEARGMMAGQRDMRATTPEVDAHGRNPGAGPTQTDNTGGQMQVSPREARHQLGDSSLSNEEALAQIRDKRLQWGEGMRRFILSEDHEWVKAMRAQNLPTGAGPSGSTRGIMQARQLLGVADPEGARAAAIGYIVPINAHSLIEVLIGAAAVDGPSPVPMNLSVYLHVAPFDTQSVYGDADFWKAVKATAAELGSG